MCLSIPELLPDMLGQHQNSCQALRMPEEKILEIQGLVMLRVLVLWKLQTPRILSVLAVIFSET